MTTPAGEVDFYFDFSSPYSYLAAESIDDMAARHGHQVNWRPMMLGVIFKATGSAPLTEQHPWRASYAVMDFRRSAEMAGVPFRYPSRFPQASHNAGRVLLWLQATAPEKARPFALAVFRSLFVHDGDIQSADNLAGIGRVLGIDEAGLRAAIQDPAIKQKLAAANDAAQSRHVFGAPTFFVGTEQFWGHDRMPHLERRLEQVAADRKAG
ncbi:MAG: 2-hydroxychromene-2-carboxylate isomerase [Burkholderiaceae bacterium]|nr:2-hydroxychromene-2-carboxylate isomerase [Burkholderiaceae bacterium]